MPLVPWHFRRGGNCVDAPRRVRQHLGMIANEIGDYYRRMGERDRLVAGAGRLEFLRTWDIMVRELPAAPATVVDVGGATGVYAGPLAEAGYQVRLIDPVPEHVADAAALAGVTASIGDARDLPVTSDSADAVLIFGPLYHLHDRPDRVRAWAEAARVVRPGGVVLGATISRYASFLDCLGSGSAEDPAFRATVDIDLATGRHLNPDAHPNWFTTAYFQHPGEIPAEVADAGLELCRIVPVEMAAGFARGRLTELIDDEGVAAWTLDVMRRFEDDPAVLAATPHLIAVARRA